MQIRPSRALAALSLAALCGLGLLGRTSRAGSAPAATPEAKAPAIEHQMQAPLTVRFDEQVNRLDNGDTELTVHIEVRSPLAFPVSMRVSLPRDASLVSGQADETLDLHQAGRVSRTFRIHGGGDLTAANPFRVVLHGEAPDRSMGLHADRTFPAQPELTVPPNAGPRVPGGRPPGPLKVR